MADTPKTSLVDDMVFAAEIAAQAMLRENEEYDIEWSDLTEEEKAALTVWIAPAVVSAKSVIVAWTLKQLAEDIRKELPNAPEWYSVSDLVEELEIMSNTHYLHAREMDES